MGSGDRGGSLTRHPPAPHTPYSTFMDTVCARYDAFVGYAAPSSLVGVQHVKPAAPYTDHGEHWARGDDVVQAYVS